MLLPLSPTLGCPGSMSLRRGAERCGLGMCMCERDLRKTRKKKRERNRRWWRTPSTWEAEAEGFLSSRSAWSTKWVPGQPGLHRETLSRKNKKQTNKQTNKDQQQNQDPSSSSFWNVRNCYQLLEVGYLTSHFISWDLLCISRTASISSTSPTVSVSLVLPTYYFQSLH